MRLPKGLLRIPSGEEVETAAKLVHIAVRAHRLLIREYFGDTAITLQGHDPLPEWSECTEAQKDYSRFPVQQLVVVAQCEPPRPMTVLIPEVLSCGCGGIGLITARVVLVEMKVLSPEGPPLPPGSLRPPDGVRLVNPPRNPAGN